MKTLKNSILMCVIGAFLIGSPMQQAFASNLSATTPKKTANAKTKTADTKTTAKDAKLDAKKSASKLVKNLHKDAVAAIKEIDEATLLVAKGETQKALPKLESAVGKIELAVQSESSDAMLPIASQVGVHELLVAPDELQKTVDRAQKLVRDGDMQNARMMIDQLSSEIEVDTVYLPLAVYPDFVKKAIRELTAGKSELALKTLGRARSSLVEKVDIVPLPVLYAQGLVDAANKAQADQSEEDALTSINKAKDQLKIAELLGYAPKGSAVYKRINGEIAKTQAAIKKSNHTSLFGSLKTKIKNMFDKKASS